MKKFFLEILDIQIGLKTTFCFKHVPGLLWKMPQKNSGSSCRVHSSLNELRKVCVYVSNKFQFI